MHVIEGHAVTTDASRLLRRLCKHWSHKYTVEFDDAAGTIQLNDVKVVLTAEPERLALRLENPVAEVPQRLTGVVAEHLQRMAGDPTLPVHWAT